MDPEPGELLGGSGVASAAGGENALLRDGARRVGLGLDLVPVVTTRADRGLGVAEQESLAVVAVEVGRLATAVTTHAQVPVSYTHLRAHETRHDLVCRL